MKIKVSHASSVLNLANLASPQTRESKGNQAVEYILNPRRTAQSLLSRSSIVSRQPIPQTCVRTKPLYISAFEVFFSNQGAQGILGRPSKQQLENVFGMPIDDWSITIWRLSLSQGPRKMTPLSNSFWKMGFSRAPTSYHRVVSAGSQTFRGMTLISSIVTIGTHILL